MGIIFEECRWRKDVSHEKKKTALLSIESWLFDRDPYINRFIIIPIWLGRISSPVYIYTLIHQGFFSLLMWVARVNSSPYKLPTLPTLSLLGGHPTLNQDHRTPSKSVDLEKSSGVQKGNPPCQDICNQTRRWFVRRIFDSNIPQMRVWMYMRETWIGFPFLIVLQNKCQGPIH